MSNKNLSVPPARGLIFVVSGPSGSGKTTLVDGLLKDGAFKKTLARSISLTTRPKRKGEVSNKDYEFITPHEFRARLKRGDVLEHTRYLDFYYGTSKERMLALTAGGIRDVLMCLDTKGAFTIRRRFPKKARLIFVLPPSEKVLQSRLKKRGRESRAELCKRLRIAKHEIACAPRFDHCVVNDSIAESVADLQGFIIEERVR